MRFGTWNVKSLYRESYLTAVSRKLVRFRLYLVCVKEVRWEKRGTVLTEGWRNELSENCGT
jgi:hypothetical protein